MLQTANLGFYTAWLDNASYAQSISAANDFRKKNGIFNESVHL